MAQADQIIRQHSRSFYLATRLLPVSVAGDVRKLYAWCRACDNAVDEAANSEQARFQIDLLKDDVNRIYAEENTCLPESDWLKDLVNRYQFPQQWPLDLLAGMESDIEFIPLETNGDLRHYCYLAAGVVGLMMSRVLGVRDARALDHAKNLGIAMQMTNIARDIAEDWDRGRIYLPREWFTPQTGGKDCTNWERRPTNSELRSAIDRLLILADRHYQTGYQGLIYLPPQVRWSIRVAANVYREIGTVIRQADYRVMERRHYVPTRRKLILVFLASMTEISDRFYGRIDHYFYSPVTGEMNMKKETMFLATFGLSLTFLMATAMFALVGINPKLDSYNQLPWLYSVSSALAAIGLGYWSRKISRQIDKAQAINPTPPLKR